MTIVTVVGARPQFIKAAPVCRAIARLGPPPRRSSSTPASTTTTHVRRLLRGAGHPRARLQPRRRLRARTASRPARDARRHRARPARARSPTGCWSTATRTRRSPARSPRPSCTSPSPTSRPACGPSTAAMPEEINRVRRRPRRRPAVLPDADRRRQPGPRGGRRAACIVVGDVMDDAARRCAARAAPVEASILRELGSSSRAAYLLATVHRAENTDDPSRAAPAICRGFRRIREPDCRSRCTRGRRNASSRAGRFGSATRPAGSSTPSAISTWSCWSRSPA